MNNAPYDVIFFDMDGTLLPLEVRDFLLPYYDLLEAAAKREGLDPVLLRDAVNDGIFSMYTHPETETNEAAFWRVFYNKFFKGQLPTAAQQAEIVDFLDRFYQDDFQYAGKTAIPKPAASKAITTLAEKGYPLYLVTMPMFPLAAIEWRMKWAACDISLFDRVTTFDNSTAVKPNLIYYRENLELAGVPAERILMVGNNTEDDLAALQVGMDAYLITDYLINQNNFDIETVKHGSIDDFAQWVEGLPACTSTTALSWRSRADELRIGNQGVN